MLKQKLTLIVNCQKVKDPIIVEILYNISHVSYEFLLIKNKIKRPN